MADPKRRPIAIIGAAIAGPTFALQILSHPILRARFRPVLFDQSPPPPSLAGAGAKPTTTPHPPSSNALARPRHHHRSGASVGVFANGLYPLYKLGLKDALRSRGVELADLAIWYGGLDGSRERLQRQGNPSWSEELGTGVMFYEWGGLREILLERVVALGGEVQWGREVVGVEARDGGASVEFADGGSEVADLVVGADGGFSRVRRFILEEKDSKTAADVWLPHFEGTTGVYGISSAREARIEPGVNPDDQNLIFVDRGYLATGPSPGGNIRWDLVLRESEPPAHQAEDAATEDRLAAAVESTDDAAEKRWLSAMLPNQYSPASTLAILREHKHVFHPAMGNLGNMFSSAHRIIRGPLRQRVWKEDEIQRGNAVLIGDASRLLLPTSGQGTGFAIEDATVLADSLLRHTSPSPDASLREALAEYARARVPRSKTMALVATAARQWSTGSAWYWRAMRYYGVKWGPSGKDMKAKSMGDRFPSNSRLDVGDTSK